MTKSDSLSSSSIGDMPRPPSTLKSACVGIPDKPTESAGDGKIWKYMPKCNKWVTAPAPTPVNAASPPLTLGSTGSTLVMDEIAAYHKRQNGKPTPPPFFTPTAPGTPKISNKITPSPTVLQDLKGDNPKVTKKADIRDTNSKSAEDTKMTPSPSKKKQVEDELSEMTLSPSKLTSPTKLNTTALDDDALMTDDIETFIHYDGEKTKKDTDNSEASTNNSAESSKRDADNSDASSKKDDDDSDASTKKDADKKEASSKRHAVGE